MEKQEELVVYWSPFYGDPSVEDVDWTILYNPPSTYNPPAHMYTELRKEINKEAKNDTLMVCPATKSIFTNVYTLSSTLGSHYRYDENQKMLMPVGQSYIGQKQFREGSLKDRLHLRLNVAWSVFAEEPLIAELTAPYFSSAKHLAYGAVAPGRYDVGSWFRSLNPEFVLNKGATEFIIEPNEPMMYVRFLTDKKIVFKQFYTDREIINIEKMCSISPDIFGPSQPLKDKYDLFRKTNMDKKLIKLIKERLID
jgi:hypothetical protein